MPQRITLDEFNEQLLSVRSYIETNAGDNREMLDRSVRLLRCAIDSELNPIQRDMTIKYYFEGLTMQQIGDVYGFNRATVSRHLDRARKRLQRALKFTFYN